MAKEFARAFYSSSRWKKCRDTFIQTRMLEDGGLCQECKERLGYIVHHKEHLTPENINDPSVTLNENNLEWVCKECHDKLHNVFQREERKYYFDKEGNFIVPPLIFYQNLPLWNRGRGSKKYAPRTYDPPPLFQKGVEQIWQTLI